MEYPNIADYPLAIYVGYVQAAEVAQHELSTPTLDDAVLLRHNLVEELDRVRGVAAERVMRGEIHDLLAFWGREQQPCHGVGGEGYRPGPAGTSTRFLG